MSCHNIIANTAGRRTDLRFRADATINSRATGAMSWAFMTALHQKPQQSYVELLNSIRDLLESKYSQRPQLSSSHPMGKFIGWSMVVLDLTNGLYSRHGLAVHHLI